MNNRPNKQFHKHRLIGHTDGLSLAEVNGTVDVPEGRSSFKTLPTYSGPGALVAMSYMDPDNWSTSITGGQDFQYLLMSAILISSLIVMLLQYMVTKSEIVTRMDLARVIRTRTSKTLGVALWILIELAVMATDIVGAIGAAIALYLFFDTSLVIAAFVTMLDISVLLLLTKVGFRKIEALVVCLIFVILSIFVYQVSLSNSDWHSSSAGFIPNSRTFSNSPVIGGETPLTGTLGIIDATAVLHNLCLHSAASQTREISRQDEGDAAQAVHFSAWDSDIQLLMVFLVNASLLIMGIVVFKTGPVQDLSFLGLYEVLSDPSAVDNGILIAAAKSSILSTLFVVALLASGQNSTIVGTLTGQAIMEDFIYMRILIWLRRLVIQLLSVIPALICVLFISTKETIEEHTAPNNLMSESQVFLAFTLPFSMIPLLIMTSSQAEVGSQFKNSFVVKLLGWFSVTSLTYLNLRGLPGQIGNFFDEQAILVQLALADQVAYVITVLILPLLAWAIGDLYKGNKKYKQYLQETIEEIE